MNLVRRKAITEREWLDKFGQSFGDDQQAMLFAQLNDILRGNLDMLINEHHEQAWHAEAECLMADAKELPF